MAKNDRPGPKGITEMQLRAAIRKHAAIPSLVAKALGCDRSNVTQRISRSPQLQELVRQVEAEALDMADAVIIDALGERDIRGRPTKEARNMARWKRDHEIRKQGFQIRLNAAAADPNAPAGVGTPVVNITIGYVEPEKSGE